MIKLNVLTLYRRRVVETIEHVRRRSPSFPEVYFDFIDDPTLNALAFTKNGDLYLGINTGSVYIIMDFFFRLLSHPEVFAEVGNRHAETICPHHSDPLVTNYYDLYNDRLAIGRAHIKNLLPKDPYRRVYAEMLSNTAFRCLVLHELAHLLRGHCHYLERQGIPLLLEFHLLDPQSEPTPHFYQAMEIDADNFAARYTTLVYANRVGIDRPRATLFGEFIVAAGALYWLFNSEVEGNPAASHPPALTRLNFFMGAIEQLLKDMEKNKNYETGELVQQWHQIAKKAQDELYTALGKIGGAGLAPKIVEAYQWTMSPSGMAYCGLLQSAYAERISEILKSSVWQPSQI